MTVEWRLRVKPAMTKGARDDGMKFVGFVEGRLGVRLFVNFGKLWRLSDIFT